MLISFTTCSRYHFEPGSIVFVTPVKPLVAKKWKDVDFQAKVLKYSNERNILKLQYYDETIMMSSFMTHMQLGCSKLAPLLPVVMAWSLLFAIFAMHLATHSLHSLLPAPHS